MLGTEDNYIAINKNAWNARTAIHITSDFYDMPGFMHGRSSLNEIELQLLGIVAGKTVLHLQCHFGQDTISLARMGAEATGVDFSGEAIAKATEIAQQLDADAKFICCDIYDLPQYLDRQFDIVFTSYGTIGWLPDMDRWAAVVSRFLKPGGRFVFAEFHPVVWMFDADFKKVAYRYFKDGAIIETDMGTYADVAAPIACQTVSWNHSMAEVVNSLIAAGLKITSLNEYDYSPYNCFTNTEEFEPGKFRIAHLGNNIPMVYAIAATKPVIVL